MKIGAEADIIACEEKYILKRRIRKKYRVLMLDEHIRKMRTKKEAMLLKVCKSHKIPVPDVSIEDEYTLKIEFIEGENLDNYIKVRSKKKVKSILDRCAFFVAQMHQNNIVHGDLTTSNIIVAIKNKKEVPYFIDFGFGNKSHRDEDKAMDIHNFIKSFDATFPALKECPRLFKEKYAVYLDSKEAFRIQNRLEKIEARGRYLKKNTSG
ncbi:MAG: Kae1-associated kinase Bud32 [Candidatus Nanohalarchaeota archaeon]|nr:MAG: Kae1-associated kinase Bud32 [Candidatus Nanohaloarchaeota archaeon]